MTHNNEPTIGTATFVWIVKYVPMIATFVMTIHCAFLLNGINLHIAEHLVGFSLLATVVLLVISFRFHFCHLHKHLICYVFIMQICIALQEHDVFGDSLTVFRYVMLFSGLILCVWSILKFNQLKNCTYSLGSHTGNE